MDLILEISNVGKNVSKVRQRVVLITGLAAKDVIVD